MLPNSSIMDFEMRLSEESCGKKIILGHLADLNLIFFLLFFFFFRATIWHMEVSRLGVKLELQLPAYATATITPDPSLICNLHHINPLSKARDRTCNLMVPSWIR